MIAAFIGLWVAKTALRKYNAPTIAYLALVVFWFPAIAVGTLLMTRTEWLEVFGSAKRPAVKS